MLLTASLNCSFLVFLIIDLCLLSMCNKFYFSSKLEASQFTVLELSGFTTEIYDTDIKILETVIMTSFKPAY